MFNIFGTVLSTLVALLVEGMYGYHIFFGNKLHCLRKVHKTLLT